MATVKVKCPYCGSEEVVLYGKSRTGKQCLLCRNPACSHKIFQMEYANNACKPGTGNVLNQMERESSAKEAAVNDETNNDVVHQMRRERCLRSMRCVFFFPVMTALSVMRLL